MADGGQDFNLGHVVGSAGEKGDDGSTVWNTSTAPTYANSKYTFTISNLSGKTGLEIAVNDIIFYSTYYYIVSAVNTTTVDCTTRISIKGSDASVTIVDNLTSDSSTSVLSAKQGKVLNTNKIETSAIATSFGSTTSDSKVPSEKLVKTELDKKITTSNTAGLVKNDGTIDTNTYLTSSSLSNYVAKSETTGLLKNDGTVDTNSYSTTSHTHGQVTSDGKVTSTAVTVASGDNILITDYSDSSKIKRVANILADHVKDSTAHSNIGSSASATQATINSSIDTALSNKVSKSQTSGLLKNDGTVDTTSYSTFSGSYTDLSNKPSIPSSSSDLSDGSSLVKTSSTSGLIKNDGTIDTTSYSTFSGSYNDLSDKPSSFTPSSHTHGNLTNDGKVGSTANYFVYTTTGGAITSKQKIGNISTSGAIGSTSGLPIITTTSGVLTTGSFGTGSGTFAEGNHTHSGYISTSSTTGLIKNDGSIDTNTYLTSSAISGMLTSSDVANNLTTTASGKVLDARQGKALADLIGDAITYINQ